MNKKETCEVFCYDEEKVNRMQENLQTVDIAGISQMLKAIADVNRAKITYSLCREEELCVCDIANILGVTVANTSHHVRTLYKEGIVTYTKEDKRQYYSMEDQHIREILTIALIHRKEVITNVWRDCRP